MFIVQSMHYILLDYVMKTTGEEGIQLQNLSFVMDFDEYNTRRRNIAL